MSSLPNSVRYLFPLAAVIMLGSLLTIWVSVALRHGEEDAAKARLDLRLTNASKT